MPKKQSIGNASHKNDMGSQHGILVLRLDVRFALLASKKRSPTSAGFLHESRIQGFQLDGLRLSIQHLVLRCRHVMKQVALIEFGIAMHGVVACRVHS